MDKNQPIRVALYDTMGPYRYSHKHVHGRPRWEQPYNLQTGFGNLDILVTIVVDPPKP
jgi:hypothetical protein